MIEVHVTLGPFATELADGAVEEMVSGALQAGVDAGGPYIQRQLAINTPGGATGLARESVIYEPGNTPGTGFVGYSEPASGYIQFANDGTRPHTPPFAPIQYWAVRKGLPPGAIWQGIRKRGTKAQHFIERTVDEVREPVAKLMGDAATAFLRRL